MILLRIISVCVVIWGAAAAAEWDWVRRSSVRGGSWVDRQSSDDAVNHLQHHVDVTNSPWTNDCCIGRYDASTGPPVMFALISVIDHVTSIAVTWNVSCKENAYARVRSKMLSVIALSDGDCLSHLPTFERHFTQQSLLRWRWFIHIELLNN